MKKTQITKMPDLSALTILPKQRELFIRDTTIFSALAYRKRQVETVDDAAVPNDYVLCEISGQSGNVQTVHVELGGGHFPALEQILAGTRAGQSVEGTIGGDPSTIRVLSVNRPREYLLSDESIAALEIPGVHTLADYRRRYIVQHGRALAERVFSALQKRLLEEVTALMEVDFSTEEMDHYHRLQREMIQGITGDADQRILDAYGYADGKTPEECERMFYEENKRTFLIYVWGRTLAADLCRVAERKHGSFALLSKLVSLDYLWNEVRVQGGAYGAGLGVSSGGSLFCYSYRDPDPARSLDIYDKIPQYLRCCCREQKPLAQLIIGAVSDSEPLQSPAQAGRSAVGRMLRGITDEERITERRELLGTTHADLLTCCDLLETAMETASVCVVAGETALDACKTEFDRRLRV